MHTTFTKLLRRTPIIMLPIPTICPLDLQTPGPCTSLTMFTVVDPVRRSIPQYKNLRPNAEGIVAPKNNPNGCIN